MPVGYERAGHLVVHGGSGGDAPTPETLTTRNVVS
jgi:hypothetical protein